MRTDYSLYLSRFFGSFGSWVTYLGIALFVQEKYGSQHVPWTFLIQTLPSFLFSNLLCRWFKDYSLKRTLIISHILMALGIFLLFLSPGLIQIYSYLIVISLISALVLPLLNEGISLWFRQDKLSEVHTRLGAIQSCTLIFAPMTGGVLTGFFGFKALFLFTAVCYLSAVFFLFFLKGAPAAGVPSAGVAREGRDNHSYGLRGSALKSLFQEYLKVTDNPSLKRIVFIWWFLMAANFLLNGVEFAIFKGQGLGAKEIGFVVGCWGIGNILSFMLSSEKIKTVFFNIRVSAFFLLVSLSGFIYLKDFTMISLSFVTAGFFNSLLSGKIRAELQKQCGNDSLGLWVFLHRTTSLIQMGVYGLIGLMLSKFSQVSQLSLTLGGFSLMAGCLVLFLGTLRYSPGRVLEKSFRDPKGNVIPNAKHHVIPNAKREESEILHA
jgi:MFS family permease